MESEVVSQLLFRRHTGAMVALDVGSPAEVVCHFSKILETRRGVQLLHTFAVVRLVGRADSF